MQPTVSEIADGIYRISTWIPEIGPTGFTFNQFLVVGDETLLFHTGGRGLFPLVAEAVSTVAPVESVRWITFGHVESDECGSMNQWLHAAPDATLLVGQVTADVSVADLANRPPQPWPDGETVDLGGKRVRWIDTPHVLHGWDAGLVYEEVTGTLLAGDLFTHTGGGPPMRDDDIVELAFAAEDLFRSTALTPATAPTIRKLAGLAPTTLALMHGSSFDGDCQEALTALADGYEARLLDALP